MVRTSMKFAILGALGLAVTACRGDEGLTIKRIEPTQGNYRAGNKVTIHGSGFQSGAAKQVDVFFGKRRARVLRFEGTDKIIVEPPGGAPGEVVDVVVVFPDARSSERKQAYKYIDTGGFDITTLTEGKPRE